MCCALIDPFAAEYDVQGRVITRPFRPRILIDMAVITARERPLSAVGQAFLDTLLAALAPYHATPDFIDGVQ
jgi:DNA-binding transcriptional LysR family regulator